MLVCLHLAGPANRVKAGQEGAAKGRAGQGRARAITTRPPVTLPNSGDAAKPHEMRIAPYSLSLRGAVAVAADLPSNFAARFGKPLAQLRGNGCPPRRDQA